MKKINKEIKKYIEERIDVLFEKFSHNTINDEKGNSVLTARIDELSKLEKLLT